MQLDQTTAKRLAITIIVFGVSYLILLIASLLKKRKTSGEPRVLNKYFSCGSTGVIFLCFVGTIFAMIFSTVGFVRLHSTILQVQKDGENMPSPYPDNKFFYGYQDLVEDLGNLTDTLKAKCQMADHLSKAEVNLRVADDIRELDQSYLSAIERDYISLRALVLELGGCSSNEQKAIPDSKKATDSVTFTQVRFRNVVILIAGKLSIILIAFIVSIPIVGLLFFYAFFKLSKAHFKMTEDTEQKKTTLRKASHVMLLISLICIIGFSVGLILSIVVPNAAINAKEIYAKKGPEPVLLHTPTLFQHSPSRLTKVGQLIDKYISVLETNEHVVAYTHGRKHEDHIHLAERYIISPFKNLRELVKLQDSIDDLLKFMTDSLRSSTVKPLLMMQMDQLSEIFSSSVWTGSLVGLTTSLVAFVVYFVQILMVF